MVENRDGEDSERDSIDTELGFTKWGNEWVLATRRAFYDNTQYGNVYSFVRAEDVTPLLQESRRVRIEALEHFPEIVKALQAAAEKAIRTIEDAKKLVVGRDDAPETSSRYPLVSLRATRCLWTPRPKAHGKDATDRGQPILPERPGIGPGRFHFLRSAPSRTTTFATALGAGATVRND
jgi:hypothetical protein